MFIKRSLAGLTLLSQLCVAVPPGMAQIIDSSTSSKSSESSESSDLSTWEQTPGGGDAWVEGPPPDMPQGFNLGYNVWRAVPKGASLGRTIKFGDLANTRLPDGSQYFRDRNRSIEDLLSRQGRSPKDVAIGENSYTSGLTLGEVIQANGGKLPRALQERLTGGGTSLRGGLGGEKRSGSSQLQQIGAVGGTAIKVLSNNPIIQEIPLSELASGDFQGALDIGIQRGAVELVKVLPVEFKDLPVGAVLGSLASGDYKAALKAGIAYGGQKLVNYILSNPALKNLPIGAIAKDLPISELGNIITAPLQTLPRIASQYIAKIPGIKNAPLIEAGLTVAITLVKGDITVDLDVAYAGKREQPGPRAFTGGTPDNKFTPTNCVINSKKKGRGKTHNCALFEMGYMNAGANRGRYKGMQMVDGQTQWAKGGKGFLAKVNGGWEPTGWKPFGNGGGYNPAKLSLKNIREYPGKGKPAQADVQIDLQITVSFWGKTFATPHFIPIPSPFKATQNKPLLLMASGAPPKAVQDAIDNLNGSPAQCDLQRKVEAGNVASIKTGDGTEPSTTVTTKSKKSNQAQYLARIAAGESSGGTNLGAVPGPGSDAPYGEYQFRASTRNAVLAQYPNLDAWSDNKATRDKATLAWIGLYGNEIGVDLLGSIQRGDFALADKALGKNQFTSLPGGSDASPVWSDPENLKKYGPGGSAPGGAPNGINDCYSSVPGSGSSLGAYTGPTSGAFMNPVMGKGPMTSDFGPRSSPCAGCSSNHMGVDYGVPDGTPVVSAANGKIVYQGYLSGYGNTVFVDHGNGTMTQYSHLQEYVGRVGTTVPQGAVIALSGHSGAGTGPHLHFGVLKGTSGGNIHTGDYVDPENFLRR